MPAANKNSPSILPSPAVFLVLGIVAGLAIFGRNYLLFHVFAELFTASVTLVVFSIAWHTRKFTSSDYLTYIGMAVLPVGLITILHALSYRGMAILPGYTADLPTQLWLIARTIQASALLLAPRFLVRKLRRPGLVLAAYCVVAAVLAAAAFRGMLPPAFIEGQGLTPYKIGMEYVIIVMTLLGAMGLMRERRGLAFAPRSLLLASMASTVVAELAFTLYNDPVGAWNRVGHVAHVAAFLLVYIALVQGSLESPLYTLFGELRQRERALARAYEGEHLISETLQAAIAVQPQDVHGVEVSHHYLPAPGPARIGGDFYDVFVLPKGLVAFTIGDVCGKGLRAASTTMKARSAIRALSLSHDEPSEVLEAVNSYLYRELPDDSFVTAVFGTIDTASGTLKIAVAGHPDPVICGRSDHQPPAHARSHPLGLFEPLDVETWQALLTPGESLVLVTDGVIEAPGDSGRFGSERLHRILDGLACAESPEDVVRAVMNRLRHHAGEELDDDVAVLVLRYAPSTAA